MTATMFSRIRNLTNIVHRFVRTVPPIDWKRQYSLSSASPLPPIITESAIITVDAAKAIDATAKIASETLKIFFI